MFADLLTGSSVPAMALKDISINKARKGNKEPTKSTLIMHSVQTVKQSKITSPHSDNSTNYGKGDSTTTTDYTDDASDSVGDASITSKDSGRNVRTISFVMEFLRLKDFLVLNCLIL